MTPFEKIYLDVIRSVVLRVVTDKLNQLLPILRSQHNFSGDLERKIADIKIQTRGLQVVATIDSGIVIPGRSGPVNLEVLLDEGTSPYFTPTAEIQDWVQKQLGQNPKEARRSAFAISKAHAKQGNPVKNPVFTSKKRRGWFSDNFNATECEAQLANDIERELIDVLGAELERLSQE